MFYTYAAKKLSEQNILNKGFSDKRKQTDSIFQIRWNQMWLRLLPKYVQNRTAQPIFKCQQ